jgi:hypothetical protein
MGGGVNKKENVENMEHKDSIELPNLDKGNKENQDNNRYSLKKNGSNSHSILKPIQNPIQKTLRRNDT